MNKFLLLVIITFFATVIAYNKRLSTLHTAYKHKNGKVNLYFRLEDEF